MSETTAIVLPVFAVVLLGYAMAKTPLLPKAGIKGLSNFVFYAAIPCLLFREMSTLEVPDTVDPAIIPAYFGACGVVFFLAWLLSQRTFGVPRDAAAIFGMGCTFGNTVLLGIPLVFRAFGEEGLLAILFIVSFHPLILITLPTVLIELVRGESGKIGATLWSAVKALARNPVVVGMLAGLGYGTTGLGLIEPVEAFIDMMAAAAPPTALFALGATMTTYRIAGSLPESLTIVVIKLALLPLAVWISCEWIFGMDPLWTAVATLNAAMPVGANVFLLAQAYDLFVQRTTTAVLVSTGLAIFTSAAVLAILTPLGP